MDTFSWKHVMDEHLSDDLQQKLAHATVGIAGAGGLGSNCAVILTRTGIGKLIIVDHDSVAISNLNRQQYTRQHIGQPKVHALKETLLQINPTLQIITHQYSMNSKNIMDIFADCQVIVEAVDNAITKRLLVETLITNKYTVISASGLAGWGGTMTTKKLGQHLIVVGDHTYPVSPNKPPLAPRVTMAASMQADAVICTLLNTPLTKI